MELNKKMNKKTKKNKYIVMRLKISSLETTTACCYLYKNYYFFSQNLFVCFKNIKFKILFFSPLRGSFVSYSNISRLKKKYIYTKFYISVWIIILAKRQISRYFNKSQTIIPFYTIYGKLFRAY